MKEFIIDGVIGLDVFSSNIRNFLNEDANNENILIKVSSPGGLIFEGIEIFNLFNDYSKNINTVTFQVTSLAASIASYIILSGNEVKANDNSTIVIHNAWSLMVGDHRDMRKEADILEKLTNIIAKAYAKKSKKSQKEIKELMDNETFFIGNDLAKSGFVDEIIKSNKDDSKEELLMLAQGRISGCLESIRKSGKYENDLQKASALLNVNNISNELSGNKKNEEQEEKLQQREEIKIMDKNEFKKEYPDLYNEVQKESFEAGIEKERKRVNAHITLGQKTGATDKALDFIGKGVSITDEEVQAEYISAGIINQKKNDRVEDNPEDLKTPNEKNEINDEDTEKVIEKFNKLYGKGGK